MAFFFSIVSVFYSWTRDIFNWWYESEIYS